MDNRGYVEMDYVRNMHSDLNAYADPMRFMVPQNTGQYNVSDDNGNETSVKYGNVSTPGSTASSDSFSSSTSSSSVQDASKMSKKRKTGN